MLDKEFYWYLANQDELVEKYNGKYLLIKDKKVAGFFDSSLDALTEGEEKFKMGTFIIQLCTPGESAYTMNFHSRVTFIK